MSLFICNYCLRTHPNPGAKAKHEKHCKLNPDYVKAFRSPFAGVKKGNIPWNKGKKSSIPAWNKGIKGSTSGRASSEEKELKRIQKISEKAKINNGGYRKGSGRGKKGYYKNIWCDSSWELAFVIYNIDHNIPFLRNTKFFLYKYKGITKKYYPDFIINDTYYEIKGYYSDQFQSKLDHFNEKICILDKQSIKKYTDYAMAKYGKDYTKLYHFGE
jgi:hypothetical protein